MRRVSAALALLFVVATTASAGTARTSDRIVFQSDRDGPDDLYVMNADGSNLHRLTTSGSPENIGFKSEQSAFRPRWSPDKREIAYTWFRGAAASVVVITDTGAVKRRLPLNTGLASWSPDGSSLAVVCGSNETLCLTPGKSGPMHHLIDVGSTSSPPTWSPDGKTIVVSGYRSSEPPLLNDHPILIRLPANQSPGQEDYEADVGVGGMPDWSPDGKKIVYASTATHADNPEIYVVDVDKKGRPIGKPLRLTNHPGIDAFPAWSPDGKRIAFARQSGTHSIDIYVMNADGSGLKRLTHDHAADVAPDW